MGSPEVPRRLRKRRNLLICQRVHVRPDVHATRLAKRLAPDVIAEGVVEQVPAPLDGELVGRGVYPDEAALVVLAHAWIW